MPHTIYSNFVLANEIEDQYNSYLDLARFCTIDNSLVGTPGMKKVINVYRATNGTEKLAMGVGNSKDIEVTYTDEDYTILMAQNRFKYFDEQEMTDPMLVTTGVRHMAVDMFNTVNAEIYAEFMKVGATQTLYTGAANTGFDFGIFADAVAVLNVAAEDAQGMEIFAFVAPEDVAGLRKSLKDDLKYVESFVRTGYIGTVAGVNIYTKKDAEVGTICGGLRTAVTLFNKKGTEVEQNRNADIRENTIWSRKYYLAALTDETKAFKLVKGAKE